MRSWRRGQERGETTAICSCATVGARCGGHQDMPGSRNGTWSHASWLSSRIGEVVHSVEVTWTLMGATICCSGIDCGQNGAGTISWRIRGTLQQGTGLRLQDG